MDSAKSFELEAKHLARTLNDPGITGVKCWYCDARLIKSGAKRVFLGINPAGDTFSQQFDQENGYIDAPYEGRWYNAFLDEQIWGSGASLQSAVCRASEAMYGKAWERTLRQTACLNLVPFRSPKITDLKRETYEIGMAWGIKVLQHLRPSLIISNGNGRQSAWGALSEDCSDETVIPLGAVGSTARLKEAFIVTGPLAGSRVIGLPTLTRFAWDELFDKLETLGPF